jgi:cytochrome c oxidase subunit 2
VQTGPPSTLEPGGPQAAWIAEIWWLEFGLALVVFGLVLGALLYALFRRRAGQPEEPLGPAATPYLRQPTSRFANSRFVIVGGVVLPLVVLMPLFVYAVVLLRWLAAPQTAPAVEIEVVGHQYWWTVRYPGYQFDTANEIHLPVGQPVRLSLTSTDVIHSFWVPRLMGKQDMLPGRQIESWIQADQPGQYWGQCAELCGLQHAKMAFVVVAEPSDEFEAWVEHQRRPAAAPADLQTQRGAQVFARQGCIACHAVRYGNTPTGGEIGPDLTHVGSRLTLGAGVLENNRGNLGGWIANPQALKPGNNMPAVALSADDLLAVIAYLESLK